MSQGVLDDNRRILIIDDNHDIHADYRRVLIDVHDADTLAAAETALFGDAPAAIAPAHAFQLAYAYQGAEGYELLRQENQAGRPFALAFVDMRMPPGWDGLETIKRLWQVEPSLQVVLCTAYSDYSWLEICEALSPGDRLLILKKPFDAIEVRQVAATLVTKWNLRRAAERSQRELEREVEERTHELQLAKEAADRASQTKSRFLANISHEIRTPLTAILGFCKLLADGGHDADQHAEYLQIIRASAEHQLALINDLLDVAKIEAGQLQIHRVACSAPDIIDEVLQTLRFRAEEKRLRLVSEYPTASMRTIYTDPSRLRQLLINVVSNALKFTASGSVRVVAQEQWVDGRRALRIDVIDTGIGIPIDRQQAIFDPFVQADSSIAPRFGGTGLGLSISRSIAGLLGGGLTVASREGQGSTFRLIVDAEPPQIAEPAGATTLAATRDASSEGTSSLAERRILLVEDNPFNRKLIDITLSRAGAHVDTAENGLLGVEKAAKAGYDLVLMDMQMPVMDGHAATERLRAAGFRGPIIALTAQALPTQRERCLRAGCDAFVAKPIDLDHLKAVIAHRLSTDSRWQAVPAPVSPEDRDDSPEYLALVNGFMASLDDSVASLRQALADRDYTALAAIAHNLKGSGGTFGFDELSAAAERLESAVRQRQDGASNVALEELASLVAAGCPSPSLCR